MKIYAVRNNFPPHWFLAVFIVGFFHPVFAFPQPVTNAELLGEGKNLYEHRADGCVGLHAKAETINTAIADFEKVYKVSDMQEEAGLYLIRCYNYKGRFVSTGNEKKTTFEKGKILGETLIEKYPKSAPILFEYLCVLGLWGNEIGAIQAAWDGLIGKMKGGTERLIQLDPNYGGCGGKMILGTIHIRAPYIPLVLTWPDDATGLKYLEEAARTFPGEFKNLFFYGEALYKKGYKDKAKEYMRKIISMTPHPQLYLEDMQFQKDAEQLLKTWN